MNANRKRAQAVRLVAFAIAVAVTNRYALAQSQPACHSIATPGSLKWNVAYSPGGTWTFVISQDAGGTVTGTGISVSSGCPAGTESTLNGTANGDGTFSVTQFTSACRSGARDETTKSTITLSGPGCAKATGTYTDTFTNDFGETQTSSGTVALSDESGVQAQGETTSAYMWYEVNNPAIADFWQNIQPTTYDFQGRKVTEAFPPTFQTTCKRTVLPSPMGVTIYPLVTSEQTTGGFLAGDGITTGYGDRVGLDVQLLDLIRENGDAPCQIWTQQTVSIDTASGSTAYQTNTLAMNIGFSTYSVERGNPPQVAPTRELATPTTTKVTAVISEIATLLMQTVH